MRMSEEAEAVEAEARQTRSDELRCQSLIVLTVEWMIVNKMYLVTLEQFHHANDECDEP